MYFLWEVCRKGSNNKWISANYLYNYCSEIDDETPITCFYDYL